MSRFSQSLSVSTDRSNVFRGFMNPFPIKLLSNLSSLTLGTDATTSEDAKVATITEQFLPRKQDAVFGDQFIFQTSSLRQRINAKLVLLPPIPCDAPPFAKSVAYFSSLSGSIGATVYRLPGAENHFFRLYLFARGASVKVTLPPLFRGVVSIKNHDGVCQRSQLRCCRAFRTRMRRGFIRLDSCALENDDEVYIHTEGKVELRLMSLSANEGSEEVVGSRVGRHVRRIFRPTRRT